MELKFLAVSLVLAMTVSPTLDYAYTVSADHQVVKYDLQVSCRSVFTVFSLTGPRPLRQAFGKNEQGDQQSPEPTRFATKQIGNSAIAVSPDGRIVAVGGWDGRYARHASFNARGWLTDGLLTVYVCTRPRRSNRSEHWLTIGKHAILSLSRIPHCQDNQQPRIWIQRLVRKTRRP